MVARDRIRLTGRLREAPAYAGAFYWRGERASSVELFRPEPSKSTLVAAFELARERDMILCGFVRESSFNVYAGALQTGG
jgi:hypothetical protein